MAGRRLIAESTRCPAPDRKAKRYPTDPHIAAHVCSLRLVKHLQPPKALAAAILAGDSPASDAIGRADVYDFLNAGANGRLPFLGTSSKIDAGTSVGILSAVLYMQPARESGREACAGRSAGCTAACLAEGTGRMSMHGPRVARRRRHASFFADRGRFLSDLASEIAAHESRARRMGKVPAIRLNGTTDLPWHRMAVVHNGVRYPNLHAAFPAVRFYEYTKQPLAVQAKGGLPSNLALTFSLSERPDAETRAAEYLTAGYGCAVVMAIPRHNPPTTFAIGATQYPTVDGDAHDARFLDPAGSIVALAAKGRAKTDTSGFVRSI